MKASELIEVLQEMMKERNDNPEVGAQSHGCCFHWHSIDEVVWDDECKEIIDTDGVIVIRV